MIINTFLFEREKDFRFIRMNLYLTNSNYVILFKFLFNKMFLVFLLG